MQVAETQATAEGSVAIDERQPTASDLSVVFFGDGEPKTPESMLAQLQAAQLEGSIAPDTYTLGGVVAALEQRCADMLGKEKAVFMPTGTLANHLAIRRLCQSRPRAVVQEQSHLYNDTGDCVQRLSGLHLLPLGAGRPFFTLGELKEAVERSNTGRVTNPIGAVMLESPVRRQGGQVMPWSDMQAIARFCTEQEIDTHLDGARLYMMSAATGIRPEAYAALFDTVYVSLYKYFGAPFGAILAGSEEFCHGLYHDRRMFGAGLASSSFAAALALRGINGFEARFVQAMTKATALFQELNKLDGVEVSRYEHGSNLFPLTLASEIDAERFVSRLRDHWVFVSADPYNQGHRHLTVNTTILRQCNPDLVAAFRDALDAGKNTGL